MIKILLDLDGTLLDFKKGEACAFKNTIAKFSQEYSLKEEDIKKFSEINERLFNEYAKNKMSRIEFQQARFKEIFEILHIDADYVKANEFFVNSLKEQGILYDDVLLALEKLSSSYELYVASNGQGKVQRKRLENAQIMSFFKDIFISEEIGYNKPDKNFFESIFNKLGDPDRSHYIIVGDRLDTDIKGGINASIKTIYINRERNKDYPYIPNFEIHSFDEILKILPQKKASS